VLELLTPAPVDPLWAVAAELKADRRTVLDLVVGVYRDETGETPVMGAVKEAELRLADAGRSKRYRGLSGNPLFNSLLAELVLGSSDLLHRATTVQTVAGTGALRLLAELAATARPGATAWISDPGYVNHAPVLRAAGLIVRRYGYLGPDGRVDADAVLDRLSGAGRGDLVVVQGACHNPTGADPDSGWWVALGDLAARRGFLPLVDLAYQGFGRGLEEDAEGLRTLASRTEQLLVAVSCSKNFGLYSERTGCAIVLDGAPERAALIRSHLETIARAAYSQPPDHGAKVVAHILSDAVLRSRWEAELGSMRERVAGIRGRLAAALADRGFGEQWTAVRAHHGLFSTLPLTLDQVLRLRAEHGVYAADSGRVNVAGLRGADVSGLADALAAVTR
jgi:aspartate aminotransferase